ncbi:esterase [Chitinophaga silvisoli]|uniref:Esterase n=2 Tax=Chitinophaga silvisoli TaxID=2291814 RepID=A0A3E1NU10_9BACT|nr:esterase [Chitinophaga silvisoli]
MPLHYLLIALLPFLKQVNSMEYLIHEPGIKTEKKKALILLHGVGSNEQDLFSLVDYLPKEYYIICPQGHFPLGGGRYAWYNVDFSTGKPVYNVQQEKESRELIRQFVGEMKAKYHLDEVYLGGFSQGGIMSYTVGLSDPKLVKGIIILSSRILEEVKPLMVKQAPELQVFVSHGKQDGTLGIHYAKEAKSFLEGMQVQLSYHEYNMGHQINQQVLADLNSWLAAQK